MVGIFTVLVFSLLAFTACGNRVTTDDLKAHDWQMDVKENKDDINFKVSFSDHIMTWAPDLSSMKSEASNEWEKMGEDLGKQIAENIKYKVEYELKGKVIHLKEDDLELDDDYTIEKDGKNIVLTPNKKDAQKFVLVPYSKKSSSKESSTADSTTEKKEPVDLSKVVDQFKKDGLEVNNLRQMTKDDYGMAPLKAKNGMVFGVQPGSDGEYQNARIFSFENLADLKDTKEYYDDLGKESSMTFSYTAADEDNLVLMQFNGDLPKEVVDKYVETADLKLTPVNFATESSTSSGSEENIGNSTNDISTAEQQRTQNSQQQAAQQMQQAADQQAAAEAQAEAQQQQQETTLSSQNDASAQYGTIQAGEGPQQIAGRYGLSVDEFLQMNGMDRGNFYLDPGQEVRVK
ncbi:LysM domain-containing protein [Enterococcus pseudoavium]|uniref:LysM domain-containing protein n=1 Tax=Enterococcus pseudoavium TaxID=44007 RepID=A0ABU3FFT6_9ENTE|nr:LysM domain-containing protein [Enterococcus pseudoavium]MDT2769615.1 LysM domain-containing protein [Enterococcus pseudoavium]